MRAYSAIQCDSQPTAQVRNAHGGPARPCFPRAQAKELWRAQLEPGWRARVRPNIHRARVEMCLRTPRAAFDLVGPTWRRPWKDARRDLGGRARGAATAVDVAVELRHRQAARATLSPRPARAQSWSGVERAAAGVAATAAAGAEKRARAEVGSISIYSPLT